MSPDKIHPLDLIFAPVDPDPDFDPEHNRKVIADTIKQNDALKRKKDREYEEGVRERTTAASQYLQSLDEGGRSSNIEKYFGKRYLAYLRGREIMEKLQGKMGIRTKDKVFEIKKEVKKNE